MTTATTAAGWRARAWAAHPELLAIGAAGPAPRRSVLRVGPVVGADLGVPHPWGVQVTAGPVLPDDDDAGTALAWCRDRGHATGWRVSVPEGLVGTRPWRDLVACDSTVMYATDPATAARLRTRPPTGVELVLDPSHAEVVAGYGGWMSDLPLAGLLVTPADMARTDRRFVVARVDGRPVGCALVWWAGGTGYLSGIGVLPEHRGRGVGRALTTAAARLAATGSGRGRADVIWLHATPEGAVLYRRMGFQAVDTEVLLGAG
jgi:ribosomal protein S18 acetylase RimI-like enzyme